jgi:exodeoxyribonuclease V gamma subunit
MLNLRLYTSNRLETLAESLAASVRRPLRSPLAPVTIVVQSQGMARWLKLQLAQRHGICSNFRFPFPRAFSYEAFRAVLPSLPYEAAYEPEDLVWRVLHRLPGFLEEPGFEVLKNYLGQENDPRKLFQLAQRIGHVFDQYLVFRPDLIRQWESGGGGDWQGRLWREISTPFREQHPASLQAKFIQHFEQAGALVDGLPERIAIFGVSALPPFYLQIFAALARHIEVSLYLLQPCEQFWGYISSEREQERILRRAGKRASEADQLHLEKGNRLLASMGQLGRDFLLLLQDAGEWQEAEPSLFSAPVGRHLLARIQADILNLEDRGRAESAASEAISQRDTSVQVHACHSPLRELEILYDQVLHWFEQDPNLAPRDILVMIPEIELYTPYIRAVFGSPEQEDLRIPFSIADGSTRAQSHVVETFLAILQLADSRLGASQVLALLEAAPVRRKFKLTEDDLELVRHWIEEVRIRWGQDEQQRAALGLPAWSENTWRQGLDRLLLGYAVAGNGEGLFQGILPYDDIEGKASEVLGSLAEFLDRLFAALNSLKTARPVPDWATTFHALLESFLEIGVAEAPEAQVLSACLEKLARAATRAGFDQPIELSVIMEQLSRDLSEDRFGAGYLTGGITFCALKPMRSIPAKVICLLGMNDRSFPRTAPQLSFDLMAQQRRLGDRSSREDDRYLFLETLISARERLYISYVGQSIKDNSTAPPSVLVSELLDYVTQAFELKGKDTIADLVLTRHRLQAFSTAYFQRGRLFSYSRENLKASQVLSPERKSPGDLVPKPLAAPEPTWRRLTLQSLAEFICNPAKFLALNRLGLRLPSQAAALDEREAFDIPGLDRYKLQQELLASKVSGANLGSARELVRASGRLPAGIAGEAYFAQLRRDVEDFHKRLRPFGPEGVQAPEQFELAVGAFVISGSFSHLTPRGLLFYRPAEIKAKDLLRAWVDHLLWNVTQADASRAGTIIVGRKSICKIAPVSQPLAKLQALLDRYWSGLSEPLKFFPESSYAFADADYKAATGSKGKSAKSPQDCALEKWNGNDFDKPGECEDKYFSLFFRNGNALDTIFEAHARAVFRPFLEIAEKVEE